HKEWLSHEKAHKTRRKSRNSLCVLCAFLWLRTLLPFRGSVAHRDLSLERDCFLIVRIDRDRAQCVLARFAAVASFEKDLAQQDVGVDEFGIPEDRRLQRRDRCFLIAATQVDATTE